MRYQPRLVANAEEGARMRDWDWGGIWRGARWARLGIILLIAGGNAWNRHAHSSEHDPRIAAGVMRAFSEEAGFTIPQGYQIERVPTGQAAVVVRPDGQRLPARTVQVGPVAHR